MISAFIILLVFGLIIYLGFLVIYATIMLSSIIFNSIVAKNISIANCWIIKYNKKIVASISLKNLDKSLYINQLFVEKTWFKKGLESALIKHLIQELPKPVYVYSPLHLVNFYTHLGFILFSSKGVNIQDLNPTKNSYTNITLVYNDEFSSSSQETDNGSNFKSEGSGCN